MNFIKTFIGKNKFALPLALITALVLSFIVVSPTLAEFQQKTIRAKNCANATFPKGAHKSTLLDPINNVLTVTWYNDDQQSSIELPYSPETHFQGCSPVAKEILTAAQWANDKEVRETCASFKEILSGKRRMEPKNGEMPNIQGARDYVAKYCK